MRVTSHLQCIIRILGDRLSIGENNSRYLSVLPDDVYGRVMAKPLV